MFDTDKMMKGLMNEAVAGVNEDLEKALSGIRCPTHGNRPELLNKVKNLDDTNLEVDCCCEVLEALVHEELG